MVDRKISELYQALFIKDEDILPIVQGGVNKKISFSDFRAAITGALVKLGEYTMPNPDIEFGLTAYRGNPVTVSSTKPGNKIVVSIKGNTLVEKDNPFGATSPSNVAKLSGVTNPVFAASDGKNSNNTAILQAELYSLQNELYDEYDGVNKKLTKRITKITFDGKNESWQTDTANGQRYFFTDLTSEISWFDADGNNNLYGYCSHYEWGSLQLGAAGERCAYIADQGKKLYVFPANPEILDVQDWCIELHSWNLNNTPLSAVYRISNPIISSASVQLSAYDGSTIVSCSDPVLKNMTTYDLDEDPWTIKPTMTVSEALGILEYSKDSADALSEKHMSNTEIHTTQAEKDAAAEHVADMEVHTNMAERNANANHISDTEIHTTQAEKDENTEHRSDAGIHASAEEKIIWSSRIIDCTCAYSSASKIFTLSRINPSDVVQGMFTVRFLTPTSFKEGDRFSLDGIIYTPSLEGSNDAVPADIFIAGKVITMNFVKP